MKLILKTNNKKTYYLQLPNYLDQDKIPAIIEDVKWLLPEDEEIVEHHIHGDQLTNEEKKQLDCWGKIVDPMILLNIDLQLR